MKKEEKARKNEEALWHGLIIFVNAHTFYHETNKGKKENLIRAVGY